MQEIDWWLEQLKDPSTDGGRRSQLERAVQYRKDDIQSDKARIDALNASLETESRALSSKQGEPLGCHADDCRQWLPWQCVATASMLPWLPSVDPWFLPSGCVAGML